MQVEFCVQKLRLLQVQLAQKLVSRRLGSYFRRFCGLRWCGRGYVEEKAHWTHLTLSRPFEVTAVTVVFDDGTVGPGVAPRGTFKTEARPHQTGRLPRLSRLASPRVLQIVSIAAANPLPKISQARGSPLIGDRASARGLPTPQGSFTAMRPAGRSTDP